MIEGLVSIIIPVFNRSDLLVEAVGSATAQTYPHREIIIVDDGSTDATPLTIERLAAAGPGIRSIRQKNCGPGIAREAGRQAAQGEFLQYLDSDDLLLPRKLEMQVAALRAWPDCDVAWGRTLHRDAAGNSVVATWKKDVGRPQTMFPTFLESRWWDTPTPLYRRTITDRAGAWSNLRLEEDWEYDCRIASLGARLCFCDEPVAIVREHAEGRLSGQRPTKERLRERARAHELIFRHAVAAGIGPDIAERQTFARMLFHLARQCGYVGLSAESQTLFSLARKAAGPERSESADFRVYSLFARTFGWRAAGTLSQLLELFRKPVKS